MTLELTVNPEYPQETGGIVSIPCDTGTDEPYGDAQQCLRQFQRGWWRTVAPQTQRKLSVDLE